MESAKETWNGLHSQERFCPRYPSEAAVRWVFRHFPKNRAAEYAVLDLGCGSGRHVLFLAGEGYRAYGCDFSDQGIRAAQNRAKEKGLVADLRSSEADALSYADASFDGVLCYGVLYYLPFARFKKAVSEIRRVLKPGGQALIVTRTKSDSRIRLAKEVGDNTYVLETLSGSAPSDVERGMTMTFLDRGDLGDVFAGFQSIAIDRTTVTHENGAFQDDDWHIGLVR